MYDVSDVTSFEKITYWIDEFKDSTVKPELLVVGNKVDSPEAVVTADMAEKFCRLSGNLRSLRCSAKTGENIDTLFEVIVDAIFKNKNIMDRLVATPKPLDEANLTPTQPEEKSSCC